MRKFLKKTICVLAAAAMGATLFAATACSDVYKSEKLDGYESKGTVISNGGFAVEKGDFIYYINGKQSYSANNTFGEVQTGAIMRIAKSELDKGNYANAQTVVPEIAYSGNNNAGIFIYGDYVYYSTPSTEKNSDGEILNSTILFKRAKLDGSEVMKGYYAKYDDNSIEYRYVEEDGVVYLIYVAKREKLYGTSYTNIHSVNTNTGVDSVLAYNVGSVIFDSADLENSRVYYTMSVTNFALSNTPYSNYNQIYTVKANETTPNTYNFDDVEDYDADKDPLYINCGTLVLDGIGWIGRNLELTQFNAKELQDSSFLTEPARSPYKYTLSNYQNGNLFYTRADSTDITPLFVASEDELLDKDHKPAVDNPSTDDCLAIESSNVSNYTYLFDGEDNLTGALVSTDNGLIKTTVEEGKLLGESVDEVDNDKTFHLTTKNTPTVLFIQGDYVYYNESGYSQNGYIIKRLNYTGVYDDYTNNLFDEEAGEYSAIRILDLDCSSDWYKPEIFGGYILFSSQTKTMTEYSSGTANYSHIMVCDINGENGIMTNKELDALNKQYESITEKIDEVDEEENDGKYNNLKNAYRYAFYTGDSARIDEIIKAYVDNGEDEEDFWSYEAVEKFKDFVAAENDWAEYNDSKRIVNGKKVYSNRRDYYYSLLGEMTAENAEEYANYLSDTYLQPLPENEEGWFDSLSKGEKAGFIIGIILGVLVLAAAGTIVAIVIIRKRKSKLPTYTKKRIKVDTTDDKSVDVYSTEDSEQQE